ncbi:hypothetical protein WME98_17970 [Sorangium sp. So ce296]|uniref:hypothetical protein n=1 Tax=Sorangium sp. So ce296 TaxID=3133296 RepID=UPI003F62533B
MSERGGSVLRREAAIVPWDELTEEQKQAGRQTHRLLVAMAESDEKVDEPRPAFLPRLDRARRSRVLLIDGGRGSGKTALLVTVLEHWRRPFVDDRDGGRDGKPPADTRPDGVDGLDDCRRRIVPIGLLDLHPLAQSTNLLMHVVGRFGRVVEALEDRGDKEAEPPAWHLASEATVRSRKRWKALIRAVAAAWDDGADERRARMDLEAYTVELEEAERQRLDLVTAFTDFIETLVAEFAKRQGPAAKGPPLFLLAVDDADMNPSRSVELLDMLRMLWHPRVAFLLTGDSELFEQTLSEHFLGEMRKPLRGQVMLEREIAVIAGKRRATALASDVYEKVIPAGHRCAVPRIPPALRLSYARVDLADALGAVHAEEEPGPTLASYFQRTPQLLEALPDRLRGQIDLADIGRLVLSDPDAPPARAASRVVEAIWRHALSMTSAQIEGIHDQTVHTDAATGALRVSLGQSVAGIWASDLRTVARTPEQPVGPQVVLSAVDRLEGVTGSGDYLPRELTAALMLAADVAADQTHGGWNTRDTSQNGYEGLFAKSLYQAVGTATSLRFAWPVPQGFSVPFYAAFSSRWKRKLLSMSKRKASWEATEREIDELARHFLHLVVYLWGESRTLRIEAKAPGWYDIARLVVDLGARGTVAWRSWAFMRAGLLAAPEYGLPASSANKWLKELRAAAGPRWGTFKEGLIDERRRRVEATGELRVDRICRDIDETFQGHDWRFVVEADESGLALARQENPEGL